MYGTALSSVSINDLLYIGKVEILGNLRYEIWIRYGKIYKTYTVEGFNGS